MAVYLIESVSSEDIEVKKICVDGMKNTIKYEVRALLRHLPNKRLSVEAEISDAIQLYSSNNPDTSVTLKSIQSDSVRIGVETSKDSPLTTDAAVQLVSEIFDECDCLH